MGYESLASEYDNVVYIYERKQINNGYYSDDVISIKQSLSDKEKKCILAEELGHHFTSAGIIIDLKNIRNVKQEHKARRWAVNKLVPLQAFIEAFEARRLNKFDLLEDLGITEEFFDDSIQYYRAQFGTFVKRDNYIITLDPTVAVIKLF